MLALESLGHLLNDLGHAACFEAKHTTESVAGQSTLSDAASDIFPRKPSFYATGKTANAKASNGPLHGSV